MHVLDASRAVGVVSALIDPAQRAAFDATNSARHAELRAVHGRKQEKPLLTSPGANRLRPTGRPTSRPSPAFLGRRVIDVPLAELVPYIDWTFFFGAWELKGTCPGIFEHPQYGQAARELYDQATALLDRIVADGSIAARGVYGFWPAATVGDDLVLYTGEDRRHVAARFPMLRQQAPIADAKPNRSLADFVAPAESGVADYVGAFAVTAGLGADDLVRASRPTTTTTTPSSSRRSPIGWPRRFVDAARGRCRSRS